MTSWELAAAAIAGAVATLLVQELYRLAGRGLRAFWIWRQDRIRQAEEAKYAAEAARIQAERDMLGLDDQSWVPQSTYWSRHGF